MTGKIVVGYDGSAAGRRALDFAIERAQAQGASVVVAHILEWSPYSFLTPEELEERHKRRNEEMKRAEEAILAPVMEKLADKGIQVESLIQYGHIAEKLTQIAKETGAMQLIVGRDGQGSLAARMFGSTAGTLVQISTVPTTIVP